MKAFGGRHRGYMHEALKWKPLNECMAVDTAAACRSKDGPSVEACSPQSLRKLETSHSTSGERFCTELKFLWRQLYTYSVPDSMPLSCHWKNTHEKSPEVHRGYET